MEINLQKLKEIIGDQLCQITVLEGDKKQLIEAYNKLIKEKNSREKEDEPEKKKRGRKKKEVVEK